jgi:hypothetical protein
MLKIITIMLPYIKLAYYFWLSSSNLISLVNLTNVFLLNQFYLLAKHLSLELLILSCLLSYLAAHTQIIAGLLFGPFFIVVVGLYDTAAMQAHCILTPPNEFHHSTPEALHTKWRERPLLAKDGTKTEK